MSTPNPLPDSNASSSKPPSKSTSKPKKPVSPTVSHVNPTLASEMSSAAAVPTTVLLNGNGNGGERQRGPVEEVIAKRMRQLGKKLVSCLPIPFSP